MKKFLLSLLAVGAVTAAAQDANYWSPATVISSDSLTAKSLNTSSSGSTNAAMTNIYTLSGKELGLQINVGAQTYGNNQSNLILSISRSLDGLNWTTNNSVQLTANLTSARTITTNITMNAVKFVKLAVYTDALESARLTNFQVIATSK
jgi:hypothetical protein